VLCLAVPFDPQIGDCTLIFKVGCFGRFEALTWLEGFGLVGIFEGSAV
jgi:hypothetical protein